MLINIGLGHLGWDMGPWAHMGPGPGAKKVHGPISQPRCPRPIKINVYIYI